MPDRGDRADAVTARQTENLLLFFQAGVPFATLAHVPPDIFFNAA